MMQEDARAAREPRTRGAKLGKRFGWLLAASVLLHLVFTPLGNWIGLGLWLLRREPVEQEQLEPKASEADVEVDLEQAFAAPEEPPEPAPQALPADDPVQFIDHVVPEPPKPAGAPAAPAVKPVDPEAAEAERAAASASVQPSVSATQPAADAGAPVASANASGGEPEPAPSASEVAAPVPSTRPIETPVALAGQVAALQERRVSVGVTLYTDRIRQHQLGRRIAELLPRLPQWDDFFGESNMNPVRDFDRMVLIGPSFARSAELVVAVQHNVPRAKIRSAVDRLVKRRGEWLPKAPVPMARTFADRAERLVVIANPHLVLVVPPAMERQVMKARLSGIPAPKGSEAAVLQIEKPRAPLARAGIDVPATIEQIRARITPLADGAVDIEFWAEDADEETARASAKAMMQSVNSSIELLSGVSNVLSRFGLGGFAAGMSFPKLSLEASGKEIRGHQVLSGEQVAFILDRVERQLLSAQRQRAPGSASGSPRAAASGAR